MFLKKKYLTFLLLFIINSSLQGQELEAEISFNHNPVSTFSQNISKPYDFNINQLLDNTSLLKVSQELSTSHTSPSQYIEKMAKSKLGKKYKWGGNGPYAYDCSGFTKEVFELNGITIPRVSKDQAKVGKKISKKYLKKGDLIFFDDKSSSVVSHVGIYLGKGKFIHASRFHKQIVISPLREYRRFFKWGRRLT